MASFVRFVTFYTSCFLIISRSPFFSFFFFNDTATTEIYTLSLHDALPIFRIALRHTSLCITARYFAMEYPGGGRSEEHTSELQSHLNLVCRLLLEKKKKKNHEHTLIRTP